MLISINPWRTMTIGVLAVGWLALVVPVTAQEMTPVAPAAPVARVAPPETTAVTATETSAEPGLSSADTTAPAVMTAPAVTDATTEQGAPSSISPFFTAPQPTATNTNTPGINDLPAMTNAPLPDPRAGDKPGWWFETALKQRGDYPAFLGVRFADTSRAVIIETPNRKLTAGQPLVYRLWVCNDLPQPMEFHLEHAVRKDKIFINHTNATGFMINGSEAQLVDRFEQSTDALAPGTYTIDATLRDQSGNLLHYRKETVELTAPKSP